MAEVGSIKSTNVEQGMYSVLGSKLSTDTSRTSSLKDDFQMTSMPEVMSGPIELFPEVIRSSETICNEDECFTFKSIPNPGLYQSYYSTAGRPIKKESCEEIYLRMVKEVKSPPVKRIVDSLSKSTLNLKYYGLDSRQMKPLTEALLASQTVQELNLMSNILNVDAMFHLGQMLRKKGPLQTLNLQHCKIGPEGAEMLGNGLEICDHLINLDLSYNDLGDEGMEVLALKLGYNISIKRLNLSHNNLTHRSGSSLADTMEENISLQDLDLSWNQISEEQGLKKFLYTASEQNESLLKLNLSWNGLGGDKIANIIKTFISQHKTLQHLNLSHNRFETASGNNKIAKGVNSSESLQTLDLSYNGITADSAFALLSGINSKAKLRVLNINNVWVKPEFDKLRRELQAQTGLRVGVEGVSGGVDIVAPDMQTLLLKRAHFLGYKPQKNKKDFGWFLLRLQKAGALVPVKKAKFEKLVQEDKIKFDEGMIDEFAKRFRDENKKIDLNLMLERYLLLFPDTTLPIPKEKKKRKTSKDSKKTLTASPQVSKDKGSRIATLTSQSGSFVKKEPTEENDTERTSKYTKSSKTGSSSVERQDGSKVEQMEKKTTLRPSKISESSHKEVTFVENINLIAISEPETKGENEQIKVADETEKTLQEESKEITNNDSSENKGKENLLEHDVKAIENIPVTDEIINNKENPNT